MKDNLNNKLGMKPFKVYLFDLSELLYLHFFPLYLVLHVFSYYSFMLSIGCWNIHDLNVSKLDDLQKFVQNMMSCVS